LYGSRTTGAVFRPIAKGESLYAALPTDRSVAEIIKTHAARVGLAPGPGGDSAASASTLTTVYRIVDSPTTDAEIHSTDPR
jgi:hypothetical protein